MPKPLISQALTDAWWGLKSRDRAELANFAQVGGRPSDHRVGRDGWLSRRVASGNITQEGRHQLLKLITGIALNVELPRAGGRPTTMRQVVLDYHADNKIVLGESKPTPPASRLASRCIEYTGPVGMCDGVLRRDLRCWEDRELDMRTTPSRTTITMCKESGADLVFIYKDRLPKDFDHTQYRAKLLNSGDVCLVPRHPEPKAAPTPIEPQPTKENTMNFNSIITKNKNAITNAGYLEAGRIANNQFAKLASKKLPIMVRGYADTALGKVVIANLAMAAAAQFRPQDTRLAELTMAMTTSALQEAIQTIDIEGFLDQLLDSSEIKRALGKLGADEPKAAAPASERK